MKARASRTAEGRTLNGAAPPDRHVRADLAIEIKNFGPVSEGRITLKPLTIFIGPNNSGKSYTAMLVHSILSAENRLFPAPGLLDNLGSGLVSNIYEKFEPDITAAVRNAAKAGPVIPAGLGTMIKNYISGDLFRRAIDESIAGSFGSRIRDLVQRGRRSASVKVGSGDGFSISISDRIVTRFDTRRDFTYDPKPHVADELLAALEKMLSKNQKRPDRTRVAFAGMRMVRAIADSVAEQGRVAGTPVSSFYFPAARSGLLQAQRVISAGLAQVAQFAGMNGSSTSRITGVASDFVSRMHLLGDWRTGFSRLAAEMEAELLNGRLDLEKGEDGRPEVYYRRDGLKLPLYMASSTVSEVAPLSLYLKHVAVPGLLLIIEEPEAHLHASNQVILAKYIVRMVREGLNVLVTTHSPVMVDVLGTYMRSSAVNPAFRKKMGLDPDDYLEIDEVAPYKFTKSAGGGYEIKKIRTNMEDGIPQDEYIKVIDGIYRSMTQLERKLRG